MTLYNLTLKNQRLLDIKNVSLIAGDVCNFEHLYEGLKEKNMDFSTFIAFKDTNTYLTLVDPIEIRTRGCNAKDGVEIFSKR